MDGHFDLARQLWERGNAEAGPSGQLLSFWAQREARVGNVRAARELLARAQALEPGHVHAVQVNMWCRGMGGG